MHVAREQVNHQRLARIVQDGNALLPREPALLDLPIALPSVPLLNPILTPIVAGPTPTLPPSAPAPTPSNSGSSGSGGNSGSGSGSSGSGSSNNGSTGSSGNTGSSGGAQGSGSGNGSGGESSVGASASNVTPSSVTAGSSSPNGSSSNDSSSNDSSSNDSSSNDSSSNNSSSDASSSSAGSGSHPNNDFSGGIGAVSSSTNFAASSPGGTQIGDETPGNVVNVGSDPSSVTAPTHNSHSATPSAGHPASSAAGIQSSGGTSGSGGSGGVISPAGGETSSGSHGLSGGAIGGIVIAVAIFVALLFVLCLRRRNILRRAQRRTKWAGQAISSDALSWNQGNGNMGNGTMSARSSFATTYDISIGGHSDHGDIPAVPPMAEIRDTHSPGFMTHTQQTDYNDVMLITPTSPPPASPLIKFDDDSKNRRNSGNSDHSTGSDPYSQYLIIREPPGAVTGGNGSDLPTPMSVRPFSPSEAFTFPKPPTTPGDEKAPINPFMDTNAEFNETEVIRRPFVPTLEDEMRVSVGERVKVIQVFSDGWTLIERLAADDKKGKGTSSEGSVRGLIPVDCLREAGQELPAFLASKRVSGYYGSLASPV